MLGPQPVVRLRITGPKPLVDSHFGRRHPHPMPCVPGEILRSSPAAGWPPSARPQISVCRSAASTGWPISSPTACVSRPMAGHRRSRSWCPAPTSPNPCCSPRSAQRRRPSPRANTAAHGPRDGDRTPRIARFRAVLHAERAIRGVRTEERKISEGRYAEPGPAGSARRSARDSPARRRPTSGDTSTAG